MAGPKITQTVELNEEHVVWLQEMAAAYALPDLDKALRVVLDFASSEAEAATIFDTIRCRRCG